MGDDNDVEYRELMSADRLTRVEQRVADLEGAVTGCLDTLLAELTQVREALSR